MYVLYLDESGLHKEAEYFVLAGLAVQEREIHWLGQDLDTLQNLYLPEAKEPVHFHASELRTGKSAPWKSLSFDQRQELKQRIYDIIRVKRVVLFGYAVEKRYAEVRGFDPYERAFEDLVSRFDMYISRQNRTAGEGEAEQRGMLVLAQSAYAKTLPVLARQLQETGTRWGTSLHNIAGSPFFAPASETRQLQLADFCSNAIYGRYNSGLSTDFDRIATKFDYDSGVLHGLSHWSTDSACGCPACFSRRLRP